ncbi:MAG: integrase [Maritimibacter sp.]|nr:integrase [Maritimibacter sp.]
MGKLTVRKVESLRDPGMYGDGEGLYLRVGPTGSKSWILRTRINGRFTKGGSPLRWEGGIGSLAMVSLAEARDKARELRKVAREGGDPRTVRDDDALTFEEAARTLYRSLEPSWKNEKHAKTWIASLEKYVFPEIGATPIEEIASGDILPLLSPIWVEKNETAKRVKQRVSAVFDWAKGAGHFAHENPVNGLSKALPSVRRKANHMPAMKHKDVPAFMAALDEREGTSARTLQFIILTAVRSGEARGAQWSEIEGDVWNVPAERMKLGVPHSVPLSKQALAVLEKVRGLDDEWVFPSTVPNKDGSQRPQSVMVFKGLMKRMGVQGITVHGFRSTFRDWAGEVARADWEVAEAALAHAVGSDVARSYARSDLFQRRRELMDAWGGYCCS